VPVSSIAFGPWLPDLPQHGHPGLIRADNVYPVENGYAPVGGWAMATAALTGWNGGGTFVGVDGAAKMLGGTSAALSTYSGSAWVSVLAVTAGRWRFAQNRQLVVAVHGGAPVAYDLTAGTAGALGGSPPDAAFVATVGAFTFLAGDPADVQTVSWSGFENAEIWAPSGSQSGALTFPDGGRITGIVGGEFALVFQRGAIHRVQYVGGEGVWQRDKISSEVGCIEAGSICQAGGLTFFLSERGFMVCDGNTVRSIGSERVDRTFFATYSRSELGSLYAATDPRHFLACWSMPGNPGQLWLYNWQLERWANVRVPLFGVYNGFTSNIGVDAVDALYAGGVDGAATAIPVDSPIFSGGEPRFYVVNAAGVSGTMTGPSLAAKFVTASNEIVKGRYVRPFNAVPITDCTNGLTLTVDARRRLGDNEGLTTKTELRASGHMPIRCQGKYLRFGLETAPGAVWSYLQGLDVEYGLGGAR
jgi:hypothetical protein